MDSLVGGLLFVYARHHLEKSLPVHEAKCRGGRAGVTLFCFVWAASMQSSLSLISIYDLEEAFYRHTVER